MFHWRAGGADLKVDVEPASLSGLGTMLVIVLLHGCQQRKIECLEYICRKIPSLGPLPKIPARGFSSGEILYANNGAKDRLHCSISPADWEGIGQTRLIAPSDCIYLAGSTRYCTATVSCWVAWLCIVEPRDRDACRFLAFCLSKTPRRNEKRSTLLD